MKHFTFFLFFFFAATFYCMAQDFEDVVYLNNGGIVRGMIIELIPFEYLDIRTSTGRLRTIDMENIERIVKERVRVESRTQNNDRSIQNDSRSLQDNNQVVRDNSRNYRDNAGSVQNDYRYSQNNNNREIQNSSRYAQNSNRYDQDYDFYDDGYYGRQNNSIRFGVRAGLNLTNWMGDDNSQTVKFFKPGFQIGAFIDIPIFPIYEDMFSIQPGLMFSQMGIRYKEDDEVLKINQNYLQIPVNFRVNMGSGGFFIQTGPYLGIGLRTKVTVKYDGETLSDAGSFKDAGFKPVDFGFGGDMGFLFGSFQAALNTQLGLANINDDYIKIKNYGLALTVSYFFGE